MFVWTLRKIFTFLFVRVFGLKVYGRENVPLTGGGIIAPNHRSNWDPLLVGCALPRMVYFMAKEELFRNYFLAKICYALGAFPLKRGMIDKKAMRKSFEILKRGDLLGIFPEGKRCHGDLLGKLHSGMASLALRLGMPIIPVAVIGSASLGKAANSLVVAIGEPIEVKKDQPTEENISNINIIVKREIESMIEKYQRNEH